MRAVLLAVLIAACKHEDPGPPCDKVTDHMLEVTKQLPGHEGMNMTGPGDRNAMIQQCVQRNYTKQERQCLMQATSIDAFATCRKTKVPGTLHPAPVPPPPAGSGSG